MVAVMVLVTLVLVPVLALVLRWRPLSPTAVIRVEPKAAGLLKRWQAVAVAVAGEPEPERAGGSRPRQRGWGQETPARRRSRRRRR